MHANAIDTCYTMSSVLRPESVMRLKDLRGGMDLLRDVSTKAL
jgi:hypothetical protein